MFSIRRLAESLASHRFFVAFENSFEARYVRANESGRFFEVIDVHARKHAGGKWGDFASAGIQIALTPGCFTSPKGMAEAECISDFARTKNLAQALAWEKSIADLGPERLNELVAARGNELLARTADARAAVEKYLGLLDRKASVLGLMAKLSEGASESESREARRLSRTEGFIGLPDRRCYDLISLLIARKAAEVECDQTKFWGKCPNLVPELNWRFQLLASRLHPEQGWELIESSSRPAYN